MIEERADHWLVQHSEVSQVKIDWAVTLLFLEGFEIRIAAPYVLTLPGREPLTIDPEDDPRLGVELLPLSRLVGAACTMFKSGELTIHFDNDIHLHVPLSHTPYEDWQLSTREGRLFIAAPGGQLQIFGPNVGPGG
ncbi:MAG: hypothetical protein GC157_11010 [Frankiales bacterium]|nr:hypothetical protein [Frankiales bacterium]